MSIKNKSTDVDYWKTLGEIHMLLAKAGATHINTRHDESRPVGLSFTIELSGTPLNFLLPAEHMAVLDLIKNDPQGKRLNGAVDLQDKALRVSWRIIKDWVAAQLAFIAARRVADKQKAMVTVFLPYVVDTTGQTLADKLLEGDNIKRLTNG